MKDPARLQAWPKRRREIQRRVRAAQPRLKRRANEETWRWINQDARQHGLRPEPRDPTPLIVLTLVLLLFIGGPLLVGGMWLEFFRSIGLVR